MQTEQAAKQERRPFHETIIDAIHHARDLDSDEALECLASLITRTKIPKGHNRIIAVWNWAAEDAAVLDEENFGVMADLLEQKQEAEAKVTSETKTSGEEKSINFDELQQETEKLLFLLNDRQPGMVTWNDFLHERLQNLHKLTGQDLGK